MCGGQDGFLPNKIQAHIFGTRSLCCIKEVAIFPLNNSIFLWGVDILLMNYSLMLKVWSQNSIEIISGIVKPKPLNSDIKLIFYHAMEIWKNKTYVKFVFKKIQEILVQSSMKDTNQRAPDILRIGKGPPNITMNQMKRL